MKARLLLLWQAHAPRERRLLLAAVAVITAALLLQLLWSAHQAREKLRRQVPLLRTQLAVMERQAADWQRLQRQPTPGALLAGDELEKFARASASALGNVSLHLTGERQLAIKGSIPFDQWIEWVAQLQGGQRLRLTRCELRPAGTPGRVEVDAEFDGSDAR